MNKKQANEYVVVMQCSSAALNRRLELKEKAWNNYKEAAKKAFILLAKKFKPNQDIKKDSLNMKEVSKEEVHNIGVTKITDEYGNIIPVEQRIIKYYYMNDSLLVYNTMNL